jgi:hypothetical protein
VEKQVADLLPMPYFHLVFTMPPAVACVAAQNQEVVYDILFRAAAQALQGIAKTPKHLGAEIGHIAVLHTWGQNLHYHPHLHCVAPGGGLALDGSHWVPSRTKFFLPVKVLSRLYRRLFLSFLNQAFIDGRLTFHGSLVPLANRADFLHHLADARKIEWVVYCKPPFGSPEQVVAYVGRYTHRVAISNNRLLEMKDGKVSFRWKDYRSDNAKKVMTLDVHDFIGRYLQHILPSRFVRIRSYGLLARRNRTTKLARCREVLNAPGPAPVTETWQAMFKRLTGHSIDECPACRQGQMQVVKRVPSIRELENSSLGQYEPRILLSRAQAGLWLRRLERLDRGGRLMAIDTS